MPVLNTSFNLASSKNYDAKQEEKADVLAPKASHLPTWVKPVAYTALTIAGIVAIYFATSAISSSTTPGSPPGSPSTAKNLSCTFKETFAEFKKKAMDGIPCAMRHLESMWRWKQKNYSSTEDEKSKIRDAFNSAYQSNSGPEFNKLKNLAINGDFETFKILQIKCSASLYCEDEIPEIKNAYYSAIAPRFNELKMKARNGDVEAMQTIRINCITNEFSCGANEVDEINKGYFHAKFGF